jgi:hypothetical protein
MPRKNSKKSKVSKKKELDLSNQLMFNINPEANPNGLVNPVMGAMSNQEKLGQLLNGITQNSFNDGIDTTISNTASLINNQLSEAVHADPGFFNENNIKKMLHYLVEPTFNKLNNMANNTQYNYNQYAGVLNEKTMNKNMKEVVEQGGGAFGFYPFGRRRVSPMMASPMMASPMMASPMMASPMMASPMMGSPTMGSPTMVPRARRIIPRVGYSFPQRGFMNYLMPRTMIVPSMTVVTHDHVVDATDKRERAIVDNYVTHTHSFNANETGVRIRNHPSYPNDHQVDILIDLKNNFYYIQGTGTNHSSIKQVVYGFNLFKDGSHAPVFDVAYRQMIDRISFRFKRNTKHSLDKLYWKNIDVNDPSKPENVPGNKNTQLPAINFGDITHGYFESNGKWVSVFRIEKRN